MARLGERSGTFTRGVACETCGSDLWVRKPRYRRIHCVECERVTGREASRRSRDKPGGRAKVAAEARSRRVNDWVGYMLANARHHAKRDGRAFDLVREDIVMPAQCPVFGIPLRIIEGTPGSRHRHDSPSLDRFDSSLGYVKDNVWVISDRANRLKNDASLEELRQLYEGLRQEGIRRFRARSSLWFRKRVA